MNLVTSHPAGEFATLPNVATPLSVIGRAVVATLTRDLTPQGLHRVQADVLDKVHRTRARGVVLDVGSLQLLDPWEFEALQRSASMIRLLGARVVLVGLSPESVEVLASMDLPAGGFDATLLSVDDALQWLGR